MNDPSARSIGRKAAKLFAGLLLVVTLFIGLASVPAGAAVFRTDDSIVIRENRLVTDDLYLSGGTIHVQSSVAGDVFAAGGTVRLSGTVNGDVIAAGGNVEIDGDVGGNLFIGAGQVTVSGRVARSVRVGAGNVTIEGDVGRDLIVGSGNLVIERGSRIGGDAVLGAGNAEIEGEIGRNVRGGMRTLEIEGKVGRDVRVDVDRLEIADGAVIGKDVVYRSERRARISGGADIGGEITKRDPISKRAKGAGTAAKVGFFFLSLVWLLVLGTVLLALFPRFARETADTLSARPWASLGLGLVLLIVVPFTILLLLITVLGVPVALILLALYIIAIYVTKVYVGYWLGDWLLYLVRGVRTHWFWALLLGVVVISLLALIPWLGYLVRLAVVLFGLGALALALSNAYLRARRAGTGAAAGGQTPPEVQSP